MNTSNLRRILILAFVAVFALAACGGDPSPTPEPTEAPTEAVEEVEETEEATEEAEEEATEEADAEEEATEEAEATQDADAEKLRQPRKQSAVMTVRPLLQTPKRRLKRLKPPRK